MKKQHFEGKVGKRWEFAQHFNESTIKPAEVLGIYMYMSQIISLKLTCLFLFSSTRFCEFCPFSTSRRNEGSTWRGLGFWLERLKAFPYAAINGIPNPLIPEDSSSVWFTRKMLLVFVLVPQKNPTCTKWKLTCTRLMFHLCSETNHLKFYMLLCRYAVKSYLYRIKVACIHVQVCRR